MPNSATHVPTNPKAHAPAGRRKNLASDFNLEDASLSADMDNESEFSVDPFLLHNSGPDSKQMRELMDDYDLDADAAARVSDLMDEYDLDADEAIAEDDSD